MFICRYIGNKYTDNLRDYSLGLSNLALIDDRILKKYFPDEVAAAILFTATLRLTKSSDYFPMIKRIAILLHLSMEQIFRISNDIKVSVLSNFTSTEKGTTIAPSSQ